MSLLLLKTAFRKLPSCQKTFKKAASFIWSYISKVVNSKSLYPVLKWFKPLFFCLHEVYWFPFWAENVEWSSSYNSMSHSPRVTVGVGPFLAGISGFKSGSSHLIALQSGKMASPVPWFPPWQNGIIWPTSKVIKWILRAAQYMVVQDWVFYYVGQKFYWVFLWHPMESMEFTFYLVTASTADGDPAPPCLLTRSLSHADVSHHSSSEHSSSHVPQKLCR